MAFFRVSNGGTGLLESLGIEVGHCGKVNNVVGFNNIVVSSFSTSYTTDTVSGAVIFNLGKEYATATMNNAHTAPWFINEDGSFAPVRFDNVPFDISNVVMLVVLTYTTQTTYGFTRK